MIITSARLLRLVLDVACFLRSVVSHWLLGMFFVSFMPLNVGFLASFSSNFAVILLALDLVVHFISHGHKNNGDGDPLIEVHPMLEDKNAEHDGQQFSDCRYERVDVLLEVVDHVINRYLTDDLERGSQDDIQTSLRVVDKELERRNELTADKCEDKNKHKTVKIGCQKQLVLARSECSFAIGLTIRKQCITDDSQQ